MAVSQHAGLHFAFNSQIAVSIILSGTVLTCSEIYDH